MRTIRRRRSRSVALAIIMIVTGVGGLVAGMGSAQADVDTAQARSFGAFVGGALLLLPETPVSALSANESTPPSGLGPFVNTTLDVNLPGILHVPVLRAAVQAGNLAGDDHTGFAAAFAEATGPVVGINAITADVISSSCTSNGDGSTGDTTVANLVIGGTPILNGTVAPNTQIVVPGVLSVILNEQIRADAPGSTSIIVRAAHITLFPSPLLPTAVLDIIIAESRCAVQGPDVLIAPTTSSSSTSSTTPSSTTSSTTPSSTTSSTTPSSTTSSTTPSSTTSSTTPSSTTSTTAFSTTSSTRPPSTTTSTTPSSTTSSTAPPSGSSVPTSTLVPIISVPPGTLSRTGANLQPLAMLSAVSVVLGLLLLIGTGRPLTANGQGGGTASGYAPARPGPEKWGPAEIVKSLWAGLAALMLLMARKLGGGRRKR